MLCGPAFGSIEFPKPAYAAAVACWIVGTYFFPLFTTFPRLHLNGERQSGKSKLLQQIADLAFNGFYFLAPTPAVLFRLIDPLRPTLCLDELERIQPDIGAIYNSGYKSGGAVARAEAQSDGRYTPVSFATFAPVALASIAELDSVMRDRTIVLRMERGADPRFINKDPRQDSAAARYHRSQCYRAALTRFVAVGRGEAAFTAPAWLRGRQRELYKPLLVLAALAAEEGDDRFREEVTEIAVSERGDRAGLPPEGAALFASLEAKLPLGQDSVAVSPKELAKELREELEQAVETPRPGDITEEKAAGLLRRYGFPKQQPRTRSGVRYLVTRAQLLEQAERFGYPIEDSDAPIPDSLDAPAV
jgi:hypothetical protein